MSAPNNQPARRVAENFEQIKAEGEVRFKKVTQILRDAIVESANELKSGAAEVSPATKEFRDSVSQRLKETYQDTLEEAREVWASRAKEDNFQDWMRAEIQAATSAMKTTIAKKSGSTSAKSTEEPAKSLPGQRLP